MNRTGFAVRFSRENLEWFFNHFESCEAVQDDTILRFRVEFPSGDVIDLSEGDWLAVVGDSYMEFSEEDLGLFFNPLAPRYANVNEEGLNGD